MSTKAEKPVDSFTSIQTAFIIAASGLGFALILFPLILLCVSCCINRRRREARSSYGISLAALRISEQARVSEDLNNNVDTISVNSYDSFNSFDENVESEERISIHEYETPIVLYENLRFLSS